MGESTPVVYGVSYSPFDVGPPQRHAGGAASGASRGRLEATAAELTGAVSITATKMLLQVRMPPHLAHLHDFLTLPSAGGIMRGDTRVPWT